MTDVICIGAGPAGLTAAYLLSKQNVSVKVLERDPVYVGGLARTVVHKGFCFDIGGHRFFSKSAEVEALWDEILGDDFLLRPRKSRIFYQGKFYSYPLKPFEALFNLGILRSTRCVLSFLQATLFPNPSPKNYEEWVTNHFGHTLFSIFFKTYTEKVWGMKCTDISADWAAQRIKGLSLGKVIINAFLPQKKADVKTLIDKFRYPRKGPGMMWQKAAERITERGGEIVLGAAADGLEYVAERGIWQVHYTLASGERKMCEARHVISSAPLREVALSLTPALPVAAQQAARALRYRDFLIVALVVRDRQLFDDNWIYIHDPSVKVGRIQNFKSWSPEMVPDQGLNCLGMEYFCFEGDGLRDSSDAALVQRATQEIVRLGLARAEDIQEGYVVRQQKAYPVYDVDYAQHVATLRAELDAHYPGLHLVGRNGMHKYNNQDHAMMTAMLTARNIIAGRQEYDVWAVNQDAEYHESDSGQQTQSGAALRMVPRSVGQ